MIHFTGDTITVEVEEYEAAIEEMATGNRDQRRLVLPLDLVIRAFDPYVETAETIVRPEIADWCAEHIAAVTRRLHTEMVVIRADGCGGYHREMQYEVAFELAALDFASDADMIAFRLRWMT